MTWRGRFNVDAAIARRGGFLYAGAVILIRLVRHAPTVLLTVALAGCSPTGPRQLDEEREPHFLAGKSRANAMDFKGAIESYTKALEANPRSASAHLELGLLCEKNELDHAAAIYHFERFLKLQPASDYAEIVRQRILACKQELAKSVSLGPVSQSLQHEFEQLTEENRRLREEVEKWRGYHRQPGAPTTNMAAALVARTPAPRESSPPPGGARVFSPPPGSTPPGANGIREPGPALTRTHKIQAGETPAGIARKYGVKVEALLAANPGLDPRRLQIGKSLKLPRP